MERIKLKVGPVVIEIASRFMLCLPARGQSLFKYPRFIYKGNQPAHISAEVKPFELLPKKILRGGRVLFTNIHHQRNEVAWIFSNTPRRYIVDYRLSVRKKIMAVNKTYTKVVIYLSGVCRGFSWSLEDVLCDCLQMVLIGYCADKGGILVHSAGLRDDRQGQGFIFAGASGAGKSTTARIWHGQRRIQVLNDDRVLVHENRGRFFLFGTPWHGNFSDYPESITAKAELKKLFFIYHASKNNARALAARDAFTFLYPNIFPAFWDKRRLGYQIDICRRLACGVPAYRLGLVKDKTVVDFVRSIK